MAKSAIIQILVNQESEDDDDQIKKSAEELKKQRPKGRRRRPGEQSRAGVIASIIDRSVE